MGTWNRLMGLGGPYLEAIAPDPEAAAPPHPRWYALDDPLPAPRLSHWALAVDDLDAAVAAHAGAGVPMAFERGDLRWRMAVPPSGRLPWDGAFPALIEWEVGPPVFPDVGARLRRLTLRHADHAGLRAALATLIEDDRIVVAPGAGLEAEIGTPAGPKTLR